MIMLSAGASSPAHGEAEEEMPSPGIRPSAAARALPLLPGRALELGGSRGEQPSSTVPADVTWYMKVLLDRFATHGRVQDSRCCRCGRTSPCAEEDQVAFLLELAGDACR